MGTLRTRSAILLLVLVTLGPSCGGGDSGGDQRTAGSVVPTFPESLPTVPKVITEGEGQKAAPRWEQLQVFTGSGNGETEMFSIVRGAATSG